MVIADQRRRRLLAVRDRFGVKPLSGDAFAVFCQDVLHSRHVEDQPFFEPCRVRGLVDHLAGMQPADRAAFEGVVLRIVSTCILAQRFGLAA